MSLIVLLFRLLIATVLFAGLVWSLIALVCVVSASIVWLRRNRSGKRWSDYRSSVHVGRVSHVRYRPVVHSFTYPLFFFCLDLAEADELFSSPSAVLRPLSRFLMRFETRHHLKNGEGAVTEKGQRFDPEKEEENMEAFTNRLCRLVSERTNGAYAPRPDRQTIRLVTHLTYFGYCFNPVSFYYFTKKGEDDNVIEAVVAEVSNTPWNEMRCYVLHPESVDVTTVKPGRTKNAVNYVFPKCFHVSPFMAMDYEYDWVFCPPNERIVVVADMVSKDKSKCFTARFDVRRRGLSPLTLCGLLTRLPVYCAVIQAWIHIEAFRLFVKGVRFIPHPEAAETTASKIIAFVMMPFFAASNWHSKIKDGETAKEKATKMN